MIPPLSFLPPARQMAVALSGGVDSLVTLHHVRQATPQATTLTALYIHHHQRPAADAEAALLATWCRALSVPFVLLHLQVPPDSDAATLRRARYKTLMTWCHEHNHLVLITGHHADDQNETFLIAAKRGSGVDGLSGMRASHRWWGIQVARPMLFFSRHQILEDARAMGLRWIEDPSNAKQTSLRTQMRHALLDTPHHLETTIAAVQAARDFFDRHIEAFFTQNVQVYPEGYITLPYPLYREQDEELARRILKQALRIVSGRAVDPRFARLARATWALYQNAKQTLSIHGCIVISTPEKIIIYREQAAIDPTPAPAHQAHLWDQRFFCQALMSDAFWAALGADGYEQIRAHLKPSTLRYAIALTQPALWSSDHRVLAAPTLNYHAEDLQLRVFFLG